MGGKGTEKKARNAAYEGRVSYPGGRAGHFAGREKKETRGSGKRRSGERGRYRLKSSGLELMGKVSPT